MRTRRNKYGVAPKADRTCDGIVFASKAEMVRYQELKLSKLGRAIKDFFCQPRYQLTKFIAYRPDFKVIDEWGMEHVEDVKGVKTRAFGVTCKLWREFGPCPLVILKRKGSTWTRTVVQGGNPAATRE